MKMYFFLLLICSMASTLLYAQIPTKPNVIKNGLKEGEWIYLFDQQWNETHVGVAFYKIVNYKSGKPIGLSTYYYSNGAKYWEGNILSDDSVDIYDGKCYNFHKNGKIAVEWNYSNGKENGICKEYYDTGILKKEFYYLNGVEDSTYKEFDKLGNLKLIVNYSKGILSGPYKKFHSNGNLIEEGTYNKSVLHGEIKFYYDSNKIKSIVNYFLGEARENKFYYENGNLKSESDFTNEPKNGKMISYHENGKKEGEFYFINGKKHGLFKLYYENGMIRFQGKYENGMKEGEHKTFNENGQLTNIDVFLHDKLKD